MYARISVSLPSIASFVLTLVCTSAKVLFARRILIVEHFSSHKSLVLHICCAFAADKNVRLAPVSIKQ